MANELVGKTGSIVCSHYHYMQVTNKEEDSMTFECMELRGMIRPSESS